MPARRSTPTRSMRYADWPAADRHAWDALFTEGDILDGRGPARHWAPATRRSNGRHYGWWLRWLALNGLLDPDVAPWTRATPPVVRSYAEHLMGSVAPRTVAALLIGLKVVLKAMRPEENWRWLMDLTNRINSWAEPSVDRSASIRPIEEIHAAAMHELQRLASTPLTTRLDRVAFRDTLIVLILSCAPIRLRNLASIEIGGHLIVADERATLKFPETETKNRQRLSFDLHPGVVPWLALYLDRVRPSFGPATGCRRLWLGFMGQPLSAHSLYGRVITTTTRLIGTPINPHSFRACAATSFAVRSPDLARLAAPLLGHKYFGTTERFYIKADQLEASRSINVALQTLRATSRGRTRS